MRYPVRPLWVIGLTWAAVCLTGAWLSASQLWIALAVAAGLFLLSLCVPYFRQFRTVTLIFAAAAVACGMLLRYETVRFHRIEPYAEQTVTLRVRVTEVSPATVLTVQEGAVPTGTRLYLWQEPIDMALRKYDVIEAEFLLIPLKAEGLERIQEKSAGILYGVSPTDDTGETWLLREGRPTLTERFTDWREALAARLQSMLDGDVGAVVTGICLGVDHRLSGDAVEAFRTGGVAHLFAVSGLHLSVLTGALLWLFRRLRVPRRLGAVVTMVAVALFCLLMGGEPSVVRAGILCLLVCGGVCLRREADACNSLGLALMLLLGADPYAVYDLGLLLSFSSVCGLLFLAPFLRERLLSLPWRGRVWKRTASAVSVTVAATVATLPIVLFFFGRLSVVGVVANVLLTLPASVLLVLGLIALIPLLLGWSVVYYPLLFAVGWLARAMLWVIKGLAALPFADVSLARTYAAVWLIGAIALVLIGYALLRRRGAWVAALCAVAILCTGLAVDSIVRRDRLIVRCFETEGDLAAYVTYEGHTVLVATPTSTETLYSVAHALPAEEIVSVEAVFLPSGEQRECGYFPIALGDSAANATFYRPSDAEITLWDGGRALWNDDGLSFVFGDVTVAFYDTAEAALVVTGDGMKVNEQGVPYILDARARPRAIIKNGELRIK